MPTPIEAYRAGYEKGQKDGLGGALAEVTMGMLRDDPGGYFAAGQRDGAAGKKFSPPSDQVRKPAADINPFDDKVAIKTVCPNCGALDWFEWKFLGRLTDPICGQSWYVGLGTYTGMQIRAAFAAGGKGARYFTSGVSGGEGAWIGRALGWFMGVLLGLGIRLEFGILMIPIQALAGLFQTKKTTSDMVTRLVVLVVTLGGLGIGIYQIRRASSLQFRVAQPAMLDQLQTRTVLPKTTKALMSMIVHKWYPALPGFPPHAGATGYEFLSDGRYRDITYYDPFFEGGQEGAAILREDDGYYGIANGILTLHINKAQPRYRIVSLTRDFLILEFIPPVPSSYQDQFRYSRHPGPGYPPIGKHGTIHVDAKW
jgi:uncharacterized protein YqgC (DUF456 family)